LKVFLTGLLSVEMHRLENGNIGNWYIASSVLQGLTSANFEVETTWQVSKSTLERLGVHDKVKVLPLGSSLPTATDLVLEVNGDLWGDNSLLLGRNKLKELLVSTWSAQKTGIPTAQMGGSLGPFVETGDLEPLAREVFDSYDSVIFREPASAKSLISSGFSNKNISVLPCPSLLFREDPTLEGENEYSRLATFSGESKKVGIAISAWNVSGSDWKTRDFSNTDLSPITSMIETLLHDGHCPVLISHSNGFSVTGDEILRKPGRDRDLVSAVLSALGESSKRVFVVSDLTPQDMWGLIGRLDFLFAGRIHAGAAAVAQGVGVQFIKYANGPEAKKVEGFAEIFNQRAPVSLENLARLDFSQLEAGLPSESKSSQKLAETEALKDESQKQFDFLGSFA